jgi:hypothetical protein
MERSSFFNAELVGEDWDRVYLAEDYARYFSSFIGNGVFPNPSTGLQAVGVDNNMNIRIKLGKAWINGYFYENTDDLIIAITPADGALNRIDRVVLRLDFLNREIKCYVKKGDFATNAVAKTLQRDSDAYELGLADIRVNKGIIKITQAEITDLRLNNSLCGIVHGVVDQVDTTAIFNQFQSWYSQKQTNYDNDIATWTQTKKDDFDSWYTTNTQAFLNQFNVWYDANTIQWNNDFTAWFNTIKQQLDGDIAAKLSADVIALQNDKVDKTRKVNNKDLTADITLTTDDIKDSNGKTVTSLMGDLATLNTTDKTSLVKAINELFTNANNGKQNWVDVIGSPLLNTDTFATLKTKTQTLKNTLATNLTAKGQSSVGTDSLSNLINKVASISTGKKYANGTVVSSSGTWNISVTGLSFKPTSIIVSGGTSGTHSTANVIYKEDFFFPYGNAVKLRSDNSITQSIPSTYMSVASNGFTITTGDANATYKWIAIE